MGHQSCCVKQKKLRKGLWSPEEDEKLYSHITQYGIGSWSSVPKLAGLERCGKSCRLRWINYLRPDLKRGMFSQEEEDLILSLHQSLGNRWAQIATRLPGRTDNEIKNYWNSCLKKKLMNKGIDPNTHKPMQTQDNDQCRDGAASLSNSAGTAQAQPSISATAGGDNRLVSSRDNFVSKQTYDSLFLSELEDHCQQSLLRSYPQMGGDPINNPDCGFHSITNLKNLEETAEYSGMSGYVMNEVKESSSSNSSALVNGQCSFCWESKNKVEPAMSEFQVFEIQKKPSVWEQGNNLQLMVNLSSGDFETFPLASLSGNLQDFQYCNNL